MFSRKLTDVLHRYAKFPVIALLGPRQSGKTTLVQHAFPKHTFLSLDHEVNQLFALEDPEGFLLTHENEHGLILDEFQYAPKLTKYIKLEVDKKKKRPGYFVLTGSQNFLANKAITESLAGRVGILNLFPLSNQELLANKLGQTVSELMFAGGYPRVYDEHIAPTDFYPSYIASYIQRDVGQLINSKNIMTFHRFVQLCAGRIGQLCNVNALAAETGISAPTAKEWLSILEANYILFFLEPHFENFNKRLVKTPKLYFFDTGLACSLLRIDSPETLRNSHFYGALFESFIVADFYKQYCNAGLCPSVYFWRDNSGAHEIDCVLEYGTKNYPVEIKAGTHIAGDAFRGLEYWHEIADGNPDETYLVYAGDEKQTRKQARVIDWRNAAALVPTIVAEKKRRIIKRKK